MRTLSIAILICFCGTSLGAESSWKPSPGEVYNPDDPRFQALDAYRRAIAAVKVQTYLTDHLSAPGDDEDSLITEFQETISGQEVTAATEFLGKYPDEEVATELLLFQIRKTSGVWPPWKRLALALADRCPGLILSQLSQLSLTERIKFIADVELAINMASGPAAVMLYPLTNEQLRQIRSSLAKVQQ